MQKPQNHHGINPAIAHLDRPNQKRILKHEAERRNCGDWGEWTRLSRQQIGPTLLRLDGWVRQVSSACRNSVFCVLIREDSTGVIHAAVSSLSGNRPSWYEMQRIKNELFGPEATAVEIYPPAQESVDGSDMFHLWILPGDIPFGLRKLAASRGSTTPAGELLLGGMTREPNP